ncbi:MAG: hypothetical protein QOH01_1292 [Verrucomicrobiota bacterium]|jgi:YD repeat-containing protein
MSKYLDATPAGPLDPSGQLTNVRYNADQVWTGAPVNQTRAVDYVYTPDRLNRSSVTDNRQVTGYGSNPMNQYVTVNGGTSLYDQNFNLYTLNGWRYDYDADKHLLLTTNGSATGSFLYDGLGRCVRRTINGTTTRFIYDGWKPFMEWSLDTGHLVAWNIYGPGPDEILWRWDEAVGHLRYHHDAHGNVTSLLDYGGNVIEKYTYDAFGQPTITDWWDNPHVDGNNRPQSWYRNQLKRGQS